MAINFIQNGPTICFKKAVVVNHAHVQSSEENSFALGGDRNLARLSYQLGLAKGFELIIQEPVSCRFIALSFAQDQLYLLRDAINAFEKLDWQYVREQERAWDAKLSGSKEL